MYGQFWYGANGFPGFLYKKNAGAGCRKSTRFAAGGNMITNQHTYIYNKYKPGCDSVGGSNSISVRRAKNRLATVCSGNSCGAFYGNLGRYAPYVYNPNGYPYYTTV